MNNKWILLTGANGGIGSFILKRLIENDYQVISLDISNSNIKNEKTTFIKCDATNREDIKNAYQKVKELTTTLFAIINTIGIYKMESLVEGNEEDFHKMFDVNFFGIYHLNKEMFPLLCKGSKIINLTSEVAKLSPQPFQAYYNLTKILLDKYTDSLRRECNYLGIQVSKIQSGSMKTNMLNNANEEYDLLVANSTHYKKPLTTFKYMMDRELRKTNDPNIIAKLIIKMLKKKKMRIRYKVKNSFALSFLSILPEKLQDYIYIRVIK